MAIKKKQSTIENEHEHDWRKAGQEAVPGLLEEWSFDQQF
jgi:hypothetical protein